MNFLVCILLLITLTVTTVYNVNARHIQNLTRKNESPYISKTSRSKTNIRSAQERNHTMPSIITLKKLVHFPVSTSKYITPDKHNITVDGGRFDDQSDDKNYIIHCRLIRPVNIKKPYPRRNQISCPIGMTPNFNGECVNMFSEDYNLA